METSDAIKVLESVGYQVRFDMTAGVYVVTLWKGYEATMSRKELVGLAQDVSYA